MIHFDRYTSVYQAIVTCNCTPYSHNDSLCNILGQATYRIYWQHLCIFWVTFTCVLDSSFFLLYWWSLTPFQPLCLTSVLAEWIQDHCCRIHILHLCAFLILDAICLLFILVIIYLWVTFALIWSTEVTMPVKQILGVRNVLRCTVLITICWLTVDYSDSAHI